MRPVEFDVLFSRRLGKHEGRRQLAFPAARTVNHVALEISVDTKQHAAPNAVGRGRVTHDADPDRERSGPASNCGDPT